MAVFWPYVLGNGYETINLVLAGRVALGLMAILFVMKMLATTVTLASGGAGGVFTSTMFVGAVLGGVFGTLTHELAPVHGDVGRVRAGGRRDHRGDDPRASSRSSWSSELTQNYGHRAPAHADVDHGCTGPRVDPPHVDLHRGAEAPRDALEGTARSDF
jgi:hypothetical protein